MAKEEIFKREGSVRSDYRIESIKYLEKLLDLNWVTPDNFEGDAFREIADVVAKNRDTNAKYSLEGQAGIRRMSDLIKVITSLSTCASSFGRLKASVEANVQDSIGFSPHVKEGAVTVAQNLFEMGEEQISAAVDSGHEMGKATILHLIEPYTAHLEVFARSNLPGGLKGVLSESGVTHTFRTKLDGVTVKLLYPFESSEVRTTIEVAPV